MLSIRPYGTHFSKILFKFTIFHSRKCTCKCRLRNAAILSQPQCVNSLRPGDAYRCQSTTSTLVQVLSFRQLSTDSLPNQRWLIVNENLRTRPVWNCYETQFSIKKIYLKITSAKCQPFCSEINVIMTYRRLQHSTQSGCKPHLKKPLKRFIGLHWIPWYSNAYKKGSFCVCAQPMWDDFTM